MSAVGASRARVITLEATKLILAGTAAPALAALLDKPMRLPGHSVIFWFLPLALGLALGRMRGRGVVMGAAAGLVAAGLGGRHPVMNFSEYVVIGAALDRFVILRPLKNLVAIFFFWFGCGLAANLARLSVKYATFFIPRPHVPSNLSGVPWQIISYSLWGLAAGLVVGLGMLVVEFQKRRAKR